MSVAATLTAAPQQANDMALLPLGQPPHQQPPVTMALADPAMFAPDPLPPRARNVPPRQGGKRRRHRPAATASSASSTVPPADDVLGHSVRVGGLISNVVVAHVCPVVSDQCFCLLTNTHMPSPTNSLQNRLNCFCNRYARLHFSGFTDIHLPLARSS